MAAWAGINVLELCDFAHEDGMMRLGGKRECVSVYVSGECRYVIYLERSTDQ